MIEISPAGRKGFTLVEVVVVLLVVGLIAAVTVPSLASVFSSGVDDVAHDVASIYGTARETAATRGVTTKVVLEVATGEFWVLASGSSEVDTVRQGRLQVGSEVRLAGGDRGWVVATFDHLGRSRSHPLVVSGGDDVREVVADSWTASVSVRSR